MKDIKLNKTYFLDVGSSCPIEIKTLEFKELGVLCEYKCSFPDRTEIIGYELFKMNGLAKPNIIKQGVLQKDKDKFLKDLNELCLKHNISISHEDGHGAFILEEYNQFNIDWIKGAFWTNEDGRKIWG